MLFFSALRIVAKHKAMCWGELLPAWVQARQLRRVRILSEVTDRRSLERSEGPTDAPFERTGRLVQQALNRQKSIWVNALAFVAGYFYCFAMILSFSSCLVTTLTRLLIVFITEPISNVLVIPVQTSSPSGFAVEYMLTSTWPTRSVCI